MKFEIINPSDGVTIESESFKVAAVVNCLLGEGRYGLRQIDAPVSEDGLEMPIFLFTSPDPWFLETFGNDFVYVASEVMDGSTELLAQCFESAKLIHGERSSLNDICGVAQEYAAGVRRKMAAAALN